MVEQVRCAEPNLVLQLHGKLEWIRRSVLRKVIIVTHNRGGGIEQHCQEIADFFAREAIFMVLKPCNGMVTCLQLNDGSDTYRLYFRLPEEMPRLLGILRFCNLSFVHFHHFLGHDECIWRIADDLGVPYYFTAHDYFLYCPRITLTDFDDRYCGENGDDCEACCNSRSNRDDSELAIWRQRSQRFLNGAKFVIAPSSDAADRYRRNFPLARVVCAPHLDIDENSIPAARMPMRTIDGEFRIAVLGALSRIKGIDLFEQAVRESGKRRLNLRFKLIGFPYRPIVANRNLAIHGEYHASELDTLLADWNPHLVWFPAQCPETYSYTLSACLRLGLPVVVPNIGAFPARIAERHLSWIVPWRSTAQDMIDLFDALHRGNAEIPTVSSRPRAKFQDFDYAYDYIGPPPTECTTTELPASWELACAPPLNREWLPKNVKKSLLTAVHRIRYSPLGSRLVGQIPMRLRQKVSRWLADER